MKEYKVMKIDWDYKLEILETTINDMTKEGWDLVCMTPPPQSSLHFVVTFCRDAGKIYND